MNNFKRITKTGLGIMVFDDTWHLRNIIEEIRDLCDLIVICLQNKSYLGSDINQDVVNFVNRLKEEKLIDDIIIFEPTEFHTEEGNAAPRLIETDKRNFILDYLERNGCSHSMVIDSDEFYDHEDFENALNTIDEHEDMKVNYCEYINYYRDYRHLMVWPFRCYVPFMSESSYRFDFKRGSFDKPSDPTRRYLINETDAKYCIFSFNLIKMHHLSWLRKNIEFKIDNWSSQLYFQNGNLKEKMINSYYGYEDGKNATIMFNTPFNQVIVNKLPHQYINPKHNFLENV